MNLSVNGLRLICGDGQFYCAMLRMHKGIVRMMIRLFSIISISFLSATMAFAQTGSGNSFSITPGQAQLNYNTTDTNLPMAEQGANTYALVDPSCGPCIARQKALLRMNDHTTFHRGVEKTSESGSKGSHTDTNQ